MYSLSLEFMLRFFSFNYTAIFLNFQQKKGARKVTYEAAGGLHTFIRSLTRRNSKIFKS